MLTDDLETYGRISVGINAGGAEWIEVGRGFETDERDSYGGVRGKDQPAKYTSGTCIALGSTT